MVSKHRLEALSDGVFAIVMTLLVLDLHVPGDAAKGHLLAALTHDTPQWACFFLTFMLAGRFWVLQHAVLVSLDKAGKGMTSLTLAFLSMVTILPFTTSLLGRHGSDPVSFFIYLLVSFALGVLLMAQIEVARRSHAFASGADAKDLRTSILPALIPTTVGLATVLVFSLRSSMILTGASAFIVHRARDARFGRLWRRLVHRQKKDRPHADHEAGPAGLPPEA